MLKKDQTDINYQQYSLHVGSCIVPVDGVGRISYGHSVYHTSPFRSITCILFPQTIFFHLILYLLFPCLFWSSKKRNEVTAAIRRAVKHHEKDLAINLKSDPKSFWKYITSKTSSLIGTDAGEFETDKEKAEILNASSFEVFIKQDTTGAQLSCLQSTNIPIPMEKTHISEETILCKMQLLGVHKAWGHDDLHPKFIEECYSEICYPLVKIFNNH